MKYTIDDLNYDCERLVGELSDLRTAKGHDYSSADDTLENLRIFGWQGVVVRLFDKMMRLKSFINKGELAVKDEKIEDTMQDTINYALYCLIMYRQEKYKFPTQESTSKQESPAPPLGTKL